MKTLQNKQITPLPFRKNQAAFITQSFITNENTFQSKNQQSKAFQNGECLTSLEDEMLNIFSKQFEAFKELLQSKKQNKLKNKLNPKNDKPSISEKKSQFNENNDKEQNLVKLKQQQNIRRNQNANQAYQSLSFIFSKTSHEGTKEQCKQSNEIIFKRVQQKDLEQLQFGPEQKKFIRSTGFIKHSNNYKDFKKVLISPQKLLLSTSQIYDHQDNHRQSNLRMDKKVMIYNKLIFVRGN